MGRTEGRAKPDRRGRRMAALFPRAAGGRERPAQTVHRSRYEGEWTFAGRPHHRPPDEALHEVSKEAFRQGPRGQGGFSTASGYRTEADPRLPSARTEPRGRRRPDPLELYWDAEVAPILKAAPGVRVIGVLEELRRRHPDLNPDIRRTLERRILAWRALQRAQQDVIFRQTMSPAGWDCPTYRRQPSRHLHRRGAAGSPALSLSARLFRLRTRSRRARRRKLRGPGRGPAERAMGLAAAEGAPQRQPLGGVPQSGGRRAGRHHRALRGADGPLRMSATRNNTGVAHENGSIESAHGHPSRRSRTPCCCAGARDFPISTPIGVSSPSSDGATPISPSPLRSKRRRWSRCREPAPPTSRRR